MPKETEEKLKFKRQKYQVFTIVSSKKKEIGSVRIEPSAISWKPDGGSLAQANDKGFWQSGRSTRHPDGRRAMTPKEEHFVRTRIGSDWLPEDDADLRKSIEVGCSIEKTAEFLMREPEECKARLDTLTSVFPRDVAAS